MSFSVVTGPARTNRFSRWTAAATASTAMKASWVVVVLGLLFASACQRGPIAEQISLGEPVESTAVNRVETLTDGRRPMEGAEWNTKGVAFLNGARAKVLYDLGEVKSIAAVYLQGDNNDRFVLEVSNDGSEFSPLWISPSVAAPGLRSRSATRLEGEGRFVRLSAIGGDRWVSISELQLFSTTPSTWPPPVEVDVELRPSHWANAALVLFALLSILTVWLHSRGTTLGRALWAASALACVVAIYSLVRAWPANVELINASRAIAAIVAAAVVLRLGWRPEQANERALLGLLAAMALLSVLTFYNFGHPQFYDGAQRKPTYVHTWDMRVYFPAVKYFDELGYDGVYLASVKAYADEELGGSLDSIRDTRLRDLRDYEMRTVAELSDEIHGVKERFTPERWEALTKDMAYFWGAMGSRTYLESLRDHGGNATPAWLLPAFWLLGSADANEATLLRVALLDPLLLLLFFIVAWRTFGVRAALVCMVAFGAATVYQFGSNWGGSLLRNDWMVLIGLGVCALKARRLTLAGGLLGWAAMIRAFPALALFFLAVPIGWKVYEAVRARRSPWPELVPLAKVGAGVVIIVVALGALSANTFGFEESWGAWTQKISMHANRPNVNHLGVTALISFEPDNLWNRLRARGEDPELWGPRTAQTMKDRQWLIWASMLFYTVLAVLACRRLRLPDAAVIGTMMIPIYFYPSNYYLHILFIWPLMLAGWGAHDRTREWSTGAATVLIACAVMWFGWLIPGNYGQFLFFSGVLLVAIVALLSLPIVNDRRASTSGTA
jgi:hypothetical protein